MLLRGSCRCGNGLARRGPAIISSLFTASAVTEKTARHDGEERVRHVPLVQTVANRGESRACIRSRAPNLPLVDTQPSYLYLTDTYVDGSIVNQLDAFNVIQIN